MDNKNNFIDNGFDFQEVLDELPKKDHSITKEIWKMGKRVSRPSVSVTSNEVEEALNNVHLKIKEGKKSRKKPANISGTILSYTRYLVAAIALIALGFGFLFVPKTVSVPFGEVTELILPDSTTVELNSGSTLKYNRLYNFTNRNITLNGEAYFSVREGAETFTVFANGSVTEVTGTTFNIRSWSSDPDSETTLSVTEGTVLFYPEMNQPNSIILNAGETSRFNSSMQSPAQPVSSVDEHLAWLDNRLVFQETPFIVILNELERSFDTQIILDVEGMEYETLTVYYNQPSSIDSVLSDICTVKGLRYTKTSNGYRIYK